MEHSDQYMSAAILGKEVESSANSVNTAAEGPAPLFYPLFGLIYEALASSPDTTDPRVDTVISCLRALKCLLDPRYSGKALLEPTAFKEFMSLSHRIAMTESAEVLVHLLTVLTTFAKYFGQYVPGGDLRRVFQKLLSFTGGHTQSSSKGSQSNAAIPPDSVYTHCLKVFAYTLRHSRHNPGASSIREPVNLLNAIA